MSSGFSIKPKEVEFYMSVARAAATMSHAVRKKVGCCLVTDNGAMVYGYNGTVAGADNCCEIEVNGGLVTKAGVVHAEVNALAKAGREGLKTVGSYAFITLAPCETCATILASFGVKGVIFEEHYRLSDGVKALLDAGLEVYRHRRTCGGELVTEQFRATRRPADGWQILGRSDSCNIRRAKAAQQNGGVCEISSMPCTC